MVFKFGICLVSVDFSFFIEFVLVFGGVGHDRVMCIPGRDENNIEARSGELILKCVLVSFGIMFISRSICFGDLKVVTLREISSFSSFVNSAFHFASGLVGWYPSFAAVSKGMDSLKISPWGSTLNSERWSPNLSAMVFWM